MTKKIGDLKFEIAHLKKRIENIEKKNKIEKIKCNLKKLNATLKLGVSISMVPIIGTIITTSNGWNPFILNEKEKPLIIQTYIDKFGNTEEKKDYNLKNESYICYYSSWQKTYNDKYKRDIYEYKISEDDHTKIQKLINSNKDINDNLIKDLFDIVRFGTKHTVQYSSFLSEKELNKNSYIEGVISKADENNVLIEKEDLEEHFNFLFDKIIYEFIIMIISGMYLSKKQFFEKIIEDLTTQPNIKDTDKIRKKLKYKMMILEKETTSKKLIKK